MIEDLDLERVVNDPDYRRRAIEELNRGAARAAGADSRDRRGKPRPSAEAERGGDLKRADARPFP